MNVNQVNLKLEGVSLTYPIFDPKNFALRNYIFNKLNINKKDTRMRVDALKNISLNLKYGDRVGLMGPNGSGKTTLLKVLSGIYKPTTGNISLSHNPHSLLDVAMGIVGDATGYENIFLMSYLRGFTKKEIEGKLDWIINFSGLNDFVRYEARTYSAGMIVRLAVSTVLSHNPEILLIDEFFSAGDKEFMDKTKERLFEMISKSGIFIMASHDENLISQICNKKIYLKNGLIEII